MVLILTKKKRLVHLLMSENLGNDLIYFWLSNKFKGPVKFSSNTLRHGLSLQETGGF